MPSLKLGIFKVVLSYLEVQLEANLRICKKTKVEGIAAYLCGNLRVEYLATICVCEENILKRA